MGDRNGGGGGERCGGVHRSVLFAVVAGGPAGPHADTQHGAGQGVQLAVWCGGEVAGAVTGVDAGDEHHEYGGYRAGQEGGYSDRYDNDGGHLPAPFSSSDRPGWVTGRSFSWVPEKQVTVTVGRGKGKTNNTVL